MSQKTTQSFFVCYTCLIWNIFKKILTNLKKKPLQPKQSPNVFVFVAASFYVGLFFCFFCLERSLLIKMSFVSSTAACKNQLQLETRMFAQIHLEHLEYRSFCKSILSSNEARCGISFVALCVFNSFHGDAVRAVSLLQAQKVLEQFKEKC